MTAPTLTGVDVLNFTENAGPTVIDSDVTFTDPDNDFDTSVLTVSGALGGDDLSIQSVGTGAGQIGFDGTTVTFGGITIGTTTGGSNGADLLITFNASATAEAIEALIENITFDAPGDPPNTTARNITFEITDQAGQSLVDPVFAAEGGTTPFGIASSDNDEDEPTFVDIDGDGDQDLFIGTSNGAIEFFRNNGTDASGAAGSTTVFVAEGGGSPFGITDQGQFSGPDFVDIDGDGDFDLFVSLENGDIAFFENTGTVTAPAFTLQTGSDNPFNGDDFGDDIAAGFVDIDADGDFDLFLGQGAAPNNILFFENTGNFSSPVFSAAGSPTGTNTPLDGASVDDQITPVFVDIDGDGDFDAFVGEFDGTVDFFRNTGSALNPIFVREGGESPFGITDGGFFVSPTFVDIDGDGDQDAFVGNDDGNTLFFRNTQSAADDRTANITITLVNDNPTIAGLPASATVTEDTLSNVDLSATSFADVDSASITVTLDASAGAFASPASGAMVGGGVTATMVSATRVTLVGSPGDINLYLGDTNNIQYTSASNVNGNAAATIMVTINDGDGSNDVAAGTVNLDVTAVNDNPTVSTLPSAVTVTEDTQSNVDLSAASFADVDSASITVTLTASAGTFAAPGDGLSVGGGVTETLQSATVITLVGAPADINTYLDTASNIQYTPAANVSGNAAATITVTMNDGAGSGNVTAGTVNVNVTAVNDAPTATGVPMDVAVTEDMASNFDLSAVSFADLDGDSLTVTITASAGTFAATTGGDVTIGGSGTGTLTLAGTVVNINTFLDTVSNIQYTSASNANGNDAATFTINANDGTVNPQVGGGNIDITAVNDAPIFTGLDGTPAFTEGGSTVVLDADVTVADVDLDSLNSGNGNFVGATLTIARNGGANSVDNFSIATGGNLTVAGSNISVGGNVVATFDISSGGQVTVTFADNGTTPTGALVDEVLQAIRYSNSNNDPSASVQLDWTFSDGNTGNAQGTGDNPGTTTGSVTVSFANVNDAPTLTATASNSTFTEGGGAQDLFNTVTASTVEVGDRITSATLTVTNVNDGVDEILSFDGSDVALTNGTMVTTATNSLGVSVSVTGTTATVSFTGATLTSAQFQTLVDGLTYHNASDSPTSAGNRVVTVTGITDDGGTANSGADSAAPNIVTTVTVTAVNDAPTLTDFGPDTGNVGYVAGSTTFVAFDSGTVANLQDAELDALNAGAGNYNGATITLVRSGGANTTDRFGIAGGTTALDNGSTVTVGATNIGTVTSGSAASGTITITLNSSATSALADTFFQSIGYTNSNGSATGTVTIDVTLNDQNTGTQGSGGAESVTQQVNVAIGNPPVIGNLMGDAAAFTEDGGAVIIDQGGDATVTDADSPANLNGGNLSVSVTGNANAAQDVLSFSSAVTLSGATAGSNVSVGGVVVGTLANNIAAGNTLQVNLNTSATTARVQALVQAATYNNTSEDPTTGARTISFVLTDDSGLSSTVATATVSVASVNDAPTLTATGGNPTFTEGGAAQDLFNTVAASAVESGDSITAATLTVTNVSDGTDEILSFDGSDVALTNGNAVMTATNGLSVSVSVTGTTATVSFTGASLTTAQFQTLVDGLAYRNTSEDPATTENRVVTITGVTDDGGTANGGADSAAPNITSTVTVAAVEDAPAVSGLGGLTVTEDAATNLDLSDVAIADVDTAGNITVTITATDAGAVLTATDGAMTGVSGVTETATGNNVVTLVGTAADITTYLDTTSNITYLTSANNTAADTISIQATDGVSMPGAASTAMVTITAVNDDPTGAGLPTDVTFTEDTADNLDLSAIALTDVDAGLSDVTLTLVASEGTLAATSGAGVTVGDSGTGTITLTGAIGNIDTFLNTAANVQYTPTLNDNGDDTATITVTINDGGNTGSGGGTDVALGTVNIDITAVNDAPTASDGNEALNTGSTFTFAASDFSFTDVDAGDSLASVRIDTLSIDNGTLELNGVAVNAADVIALADIPNLVYTPSGTGDDSITFSVSDGTVFDGTPRTFTLNVTAPAPAPAPAPTPEPEPVVIMRDETDTAPDTIEGSSAADNITAGSGGDEVDAGNGNDVVDAGGGDDTISGGVGTDSVDGGAGSDNLSGDQGDDTVLGGDGDDTIDGGSNADFLRGDAGDDSIRGGSGDDRVFAGPDDMGDDTVEGNRGSDVIGGGAGNDFIVGGDIDGNGTDASGDDSLFGGDGDDVIIGGSFDTATNMAVNGNGGRNTIFAGSGNDSIIGDDGGDTLGGGDGNDNITGGVGTDVIYGGRGQGEDTLAGGGGNDQAFGASDDDSVDGGGGDDTLFGGDGNDTVDGGADNDLIFGGAGNDNLTGGSGSDTFAFITDFGTDTITDFGTPDGDTDILDFSEIEGLILADILAGATTADGNTTLTIGTHGTIVLEGVDQIELQAIFDGGQVIVD